MSLIEDPITELPNFLAEGDARPPMRLLSCIIRPEKLEAVTEVLNSLELIGGMTVTDVRGCGRQKGYVELHRGGELPIRLLPKLRLDLVVSEEDVEAVFRAIERSAKTGQVGDGKIFVADVLNAVRIRTGEQGIGVL